MFKDLVLQDQPLFLLGLQEASGAVATDESPNALHGTISGTVSYRVVAGPLLDETSYGMGFRNQTGYVAIPLDNRYVQNTKYWTCAGWFRRNGGLANGDGFEDAFFQAHSSHAPPYYQRGIVTTELHAYGVSRGDSPAAYGNQECTSQWDPLRWWYQGGGWHYVAVTFDNGTLSVYIDGRLSARTTGLTPPDVVNVPMRLGIGNGNLPAGYGFNGDMAWCSYFTYPLKQERIVEHFMEGDNRGWEDWAARYGAVAGLRFVETSGDYTDFIRQTRDVTVTGTAPTRTAPYQADRKTHISPFNGKVQLADAATTRITIPRAAVAAALGGAFSVEWWMMDPVSNHTNGRPILGLTSAGGIAAPFMAYQNSSSGLMAAYWGNGSTHTGIGVPAGLFTYNSTWWHCVATCDGGSPARVRLWQNCRLAAENASFSQARAVDATNGFVIGACPGREGSVGTGIQGFALYPSELTEGQIASLYRSRLRSAARARTVG
jgi:hypothetical protein